MFTLSRAHTDLLTCDVSYAHRPDILHIDPTLLSFLEDCEMVYYCLRQLVAVSVASSIFSADDDDAEGRCQRSIEAAMTFVDDTISERVAGTCAQLQQQHDEMLM